MNNSQLLHIFGEVLFDNFPDGSSVLGGAPFNVAWHLQAFGQAPRLISRIGDDLAAHEIVALMKAWDMRCDGLQIDHNYPTGSVEVHLQDGEPNYDIVSPSAYDFIDAQLIGTEPTQGILYHGSLAIRNPISHVTLQSFKAKHQGKIFIDVNLRAPWWDLNILQTVLQDADWVKLNLEELFQLIPHCSEPEIAMQTFCKQFNPEILVVTCGAQGAIACDRQQQFYRIKPKLDTSVIDTVGAGDGFTAVVILGLMHRWPLPEILERAQEFASVIVTRRGATVANNDFYRSFCRQWGIKR